MPTSTIVDSANTDVTYTLPGMTATLAPMVSSNIVIPGTQNTGIKVGNAAPSYGWADLKGNFVVPASGTSAGTRETYRTGIFDLGYNATDTMDWTFHLEHIEVIGGNKYLHAHVGQNGTGVTGNLVLTVVVAHLFGFNKLLNIGTPTITIATPGVITLTGHYLKNGDVIKLTTTGALPTGLTASTNYYVVSSAANTFSLAATEGGAAIATSGTQSGTHTASLVSLMPITFTFTFTPTNLAQYQTNITDVLFAQSGGSATLFNSDIMFPDDQIWVSMTVTTLPTITGGLSAKIFLPAFDIHREVINGGTKNKDPLGGSFYV